MHEPLSTTHRVLAVDPTWYGFGYVILEPDDRLVDWGMVRIRPNESARAIARILDIARTAEPDVLVLEDCRARESRRSSRVQDFLRLLQLTARREALATVRIAPHVWRRTVAGDERATKRQIAVALAARLPVLAPSLPPVRKAWMSEDYRTALFDAAALAVAAFEASQTTRALPPAGNTP